MAAPLTNLFLEVLSPANRKRLLDASEMVDLPLRTSLQRVNEHPDYAYMLVSGIASVVTNLADGGSSEVIVIGREGLSATVSLLGPSTPPTECYMQVAGAGYRIPFPELKAAFLDTEAIRSRILEIVQQQTLSMAQISACNKLHDNEARLARWLLMVQDRLQDDVLPLTQEFLSVMLGSQRTTVAVSAGALQRAGFIEYRRGKVKILGREELEGAACDCYHVTKRLLDALFRPTIS